MDAINRLYFFCGKPCSFIAFLVIVLVSVACNPTENEKFPPVSSPIVLAKADDLVEYEVTIEEEYSYTFGIMYFINKNTPGDVDKLLKLLGKGREAIRPIKVDINLIILRLEGSISNVVFDETVSVKKLVSVEESGYFMEITKLNMDPGVYRVQAKNKLPVPDFTDRKVEFHLERSYMGK